MSGSAQGLFLKSPFARTGLYSGHSVDQFFFSGGTETGLIHVDILINESANEKSLNLSKVLRQDMKSASYQKQSNQGFPGLGNGLGHERLSRNGDQSKIMFPVGKEFFPHEKTEKQSPHDQKVNQKMEFESEENGV